MASAYPSGCGSTSCTAEGRLRAGTMGGAHSSYHKRRESLAPAAALALIRLTIMVAIGRGVVAFAAEHHEPWRVCRIIQDLAHLGEPARAAQTNASPGCAHIWQTSCRHARADSPWVRVNHVPVYPHLCVVCGLRIILNHFHLDQLALVVVHRSGARPARKVVAPTARPSSAVGWVRRGGQ